MNEIHLLDETLDLNASLNYLLSLQLSNDGFSYCIYDTVFNKYIALNYTPFNKEYDNQTLLKKIEELVDKDQLLQCEYKKVRFNYVTRKSLIVPSPLFDKDNIEALFTFNFSNEPTEQLVFNKLKKPDAYNIFSIPKSIFNFFNQYYPKISFYQQATPFLNYYLIYFKTKNQKKVYVTLNKYFIDVLVIENDQLKLYNNFAIENDDDFVFFIMNVYEQLQLNPEEVELILAGHILKKSTHFDKLKKYIRRISFERFNDVFNYSYTLRDIPEHYFINLLNLNTCE